MTTAMTFKNNDKAARLLDELLKDYQKPEDILGESGLLKQLTQAVVERALDAELTHHLGYARIKGARVELLCRLINGRSTVSISSLAPLVYDVKRLAPVIRWSRQTDHPSPRKIRGQHP